MRESIEDSSASSNNKNETVVEQTPEIPQSKRHRRRFSPDTVNDLLFLAIILLFVSILFGIIYFRVRATTDALTELLKAQRTETELQKAQLDIAKGEVIKADLAYESARKSELNRAVDVQNAQHTLTVLLSEVHDNQQAIKDNQDSIKRIVEAVGETNKLILQSSKETEAAAKQSAHEAQVAAGNAGAAAAKASAAASASGRTANVVASKVVTQSDKVKVQAQQRDLAKKQQQLTTTIKRVKKQGPSWWEKVTH